VRYRRREVVAPAPRWVAPLFLAVAAGLVPWTIYLAYVLPPRNLSRHWDLAWVGFDIAIFSMLLLTAWFARQRSSWIVLSATAAATLLVTDAWFDMVTSGQEDLPVAVAEAVLLEIPLAVLCLWVAKHATRVAEQVRRGL
jgi:hypothetical protein